MSSACPGLYSNMECIRSVRLNGNMTDWFNVDSGLKQGCILSSIMFNIYVNSLIDDINALNIGIDIDNEKLAILLYADDVVLLAENEKKTFRRCWMCLIFGVEIMLCMLMSISPKLCIVETTRYHGHILILQ